MRKQLYFFLLKLIAILIIFDSTACSERYEISIKEEVFSGYEPVNVTPIIKSHSKENHPSLIIPTSDDWLFILYLNGDNEMNDDIYKKMMSIARGVRKIRTKENEPKSDYPSIKVVGLWDGYNATKQYTDHIYLPKSYLFEFVYPSTNKESEMLNNHDLFLKDVTNTVIQSENNWFGQLHEVDMGNKSTFKNFLSWATENYPATNKVLIFATDGYGPSGSGMVLESNEVNRTLSCDFEHKSFLHTDEISEVFDELGLDEDYFECIVMDANRMCSIEELYELRTYSKSFLGSPSATPSTGIDYTNFLLQFRKDSSIYDIFTEISNYYANKNYNNKNEASISFIDLTKLRSLPVTEHATSLAEFLANQAPYKVIPNPAESGAWMSYTDTLSDKYYGFFNYDCNLKNCLSYECFSDMRGTTFDVCYELTFYTFDYGYFSKKLYDLAAESGQNIIQSYCENIYTDLSKIIVCSWRNGTSTKEGYYTKLPAINRIDENATIYGITVTGQQAYHESSPKNAYSDSSFKFNDDSNWKALLEVLPKRNRF